MATRIAIVEMRSIVLFITENMGFLIEKSVYIHSNVSNSNFELPDIHIRI